ncbi:hypothetical protein LZ32DRAFT_654724 [Colletotrichum eremochloae]|nr:hypothetical protein LZ32DRAFT_654724 [Colletotrichum eremochloae]
MPELPSLALLVVIHCAVGTLEDLQATPTTHHGSNSQQAHGSRRSWRSSAPMAISKGIFPSHASHLTTIYITR